MEWSEVSERVVVEACSAHPEDVVLLLGAGRGQVAAALAPRVRQVVVVDEEPARIEALRARRLANVEARVGRTGDPPAVPGLSVVAIHDVFRRRPKEAQQALVQRVATLLPARGLLVIGDLMWSLPRSSIDEPEQYGDELDHVQETRSLEHMVRAAGFLPDLHRFGPAVGVMIALKTGA